MIDTTYMKGSLSVKEGMHCTESVEPSLVFWYPHTMDDFVYVGWKTLLASLHKSGRRGVIRNWLTYKSSPTWQILLS